MELRRFPAAAAAMEEETMIGVRVRSFMVDNIIKRVDGGGDGGREEEWCSYCSQEKL